MEGKKKNLANTTSTVHMDSSISKPNSVGIIKSVASIIHSIIQEDVERGKKVDEKSDHFFFSEEKYIFEKPEEYDEARRALLREMPTVESIAEFMTALYECGQFSTECCIICLVYINRFIQDTEIPLLPTTWRPLIICSLLIAQKVWDDKYLSNSDFAFIYPFFSNEEVNKLEQKFLELIEYNVTVKPNVYTRYYFELRGVYQAEGEFPLEVLTKDKGSQLEATSLLIGAEKKKAKLSQTYNEKDVKSKANFILS
jgi:hypothetical protein